MHLRFVLSGAILGSAVPMSAQQNQLNTAKATPDRPNIIFILADDMGYGDLHCYGNKEIKTPNIDKLAATGTRFTQCYAGSGISSPSRCSLMTGLHTGHSRIRDNQCPVGGIRGLKITPDGDSVYNRRANLLPEDTTLATVIGSAGYRSCLVNKWHLDGYDPMAAPHHRGFDEFYGWTISTAVSNGPYYYYPSYRFHGDSLIHIDENAREAHVRHNTEISTDDAIAFINREKDHPFFLFLAYDAPHEPYHIDQTQWYDERGEWTPDTKRYAALVTHMDYNIGRVIGALNALGLRENTLIIFASDNGAAVMAPLKELNCGAGLRGHKGQLYEGGIRVPLIVNQPGRVPARELKNIIYFPDMMPTLAAITGSTRGLPRHTDGMDVHQLFYGGNADTDSRLLYWEFPGKQRAARRGDWKAVAVKPNQPLELYNIKEDMTESNNLANKYPKLVRQFDKEMKAQHTPSPYWPLTGE
jgi:arylsulfatase A-like enzyme